MRKDPIAQGGWGFIQRLWMAGCDAYVTELYAETAESAFLLECLTTDCGEEVIRAKTLLWSLGLSMGVVLAACRILEANQSWYFTNIYN